jgi:hypothetical protein
MLAACSMTMMLAGCTSSNRTALQSLPELSADLAVSPKLYSPRKGEDARLALAKSQKAGVQCVAQYDDFKGFYERLKRPSKS